MMADSAASVSVQPEVTEAAHPAPVRLRPHQEEALDELADLFFGEHQSRLLIEHPTGLGKTVVAAALGHHEAFKEWLERYPRARRRQLFLVHRDELAQQALNAFSASWPEAKVAIEQGPLTAGDADIVIASVQTLGRQSSRRMDSLDAESFRVVIIDEAHHAVASTYRSVMRHFGFEHAPEPAGATLSPPDRLLLGVTATIERADRVGLYNVFDRVAHSLPLFGMIEAGHLARLRAFLVRTQINLSAVAERAGDFEVSSLARAVNLPSRNAMVVTAYREHALGRPALVFGVDVAHAEVLADEFNRSGIPAAAVTGRLKKAVRARLISDFREGRLQVLTNCMVFTEGFDAPQVSCVILARPTRSRVLYRQMVGRGTRLAPHKNDCSIIDFVDVSPFQDLQSLGSLAGLPVDADFEGEDIVEVASLRETLAEWQPHVELPAGVTSSEMRLLLVEVPLWQEGDLTCWRQVDQATWATAVATSGLARFAVRKMGEGGWRIVRTRCPRRPPQIPGFAQAFYWRFPAPVPQDLSATYSSALEAISRVDYWLASRARTDEAGKSHFGAWLRDRSTPFWTMGDGDWRPARHFRGTRLVGRAVPGSIVLAHVDGYGHEVVGQIVVGDDRVDGYVRRNAPAATYDKVQRALNRFLRAIPDAGLKGLRLTQAELDDWYCRVFEPRGKWHYPRLRSALMDDPQPAEDGNATVTGGLGGAPRLVKRRVT